MKNISRQQIISILREIDEPYWTEGKNVSVDSVNVCCPFCPESDPDPSNHCGIFEDTGVFSCWRCEARGPIIRLLKKLTGFSESQCQSIIDNATTELSDDPAAAISSILSGEPETVTNRFDKGKIGFPEYFESVTKNTDFPLLNDWMERRNIELDALIYYRCGICRVGSYMNRLIIPVYYKDELVCYQAADLTGAAAVKYKSAYSYINDYLYNYDKIDKLMVVVEGVLDAWRVGDIAVASFGVGLTDKQMNRILDKRLEYLLFCYDGEVYHKSQYWVAQFEPFIPHVRAVRLPRKSDDELAKSNKTPCKPADYYHDPDSLGTEKILALIAENIGIK